MKRVCELSCFCVLFDVFVCYVCVILCDFVWFGLCVLLFVLVSLIYELLKCARLRCVSYCVMVCVVLRVCLWLCFCLVCLCGLFGIHCAMMYDLCCLV